MMVLQPMEFRGKINFPQFTGLRCLMMPYIQGEASSVPNDFEPYKKILESLFFKKGDIGFLTIDESTAFAGRPHRGDRAKYPRAIHTEAGKRPVGESYQWGWGSGEPVTLERDVRIILANNLDGSCAVWPTEHLNTSRDGDIGEFSEDYPYENATLMRAGEVYEIGILTPHESIPVIKDFKRQFLRIISSGVHGREEYFTQNPLVPLAI